MQKIQTLIKPLYINGLTMILHDRNLLAKIGSKRWDINKNTATSHISNFLHAFSLPF